MTAFDRPPRGSPQAGRILVLHAGCLDHRPEQGQTTDSYFMLLAFSSSAITMKVLKAHMKFIRVKRPTKERAQDSRIVLPRQKVPHQRRHGLSRKKS